MNNKKGYRSYYSYRKKDSGMLAVILYFVGMLGLVAIDQLTKLWAVNYLEKIGSMPVIGNYVMFYYTPNTGAAFNILDGQRVLLTAISVILAVACIGIIISRKLNSKLGNIALMLIAAGGIGNLVDRVVRGYVVDFIDFEVIHFAIFNFADSCVTIGVVLFIIFFIINEASSGRRKAKSAIFKKGRF